MIFNQSEFDLRCEWGSQGIIQLAAISDVVVIVDILSFSTAVEVATNNGAIIFPYRWKDSTAIDYAKSIKAELATNRTSTTGYSLSQERIGTWEAPAFIIRGGTWTRAILIAC